MMVVADRSGGTEDLGVSGDWTPFVAKIKCFRKTGLPDLCCLVVSWFEHRLKFAEELSSVGRVESFSSLEEPFIGLGFEFSIILVDDLSY